MALATSAKDGQPSVRMVLLKNGAEDGFVFYTNLESDKGKQLRDNPQAALCFYWGAIDKQVRIRGKVELVSDAEADTYFAKRPRQARIGAWASKQSQPMESRFALEKSVAKIVARHAVGKIPRPPHWAGYRLIPDAIEFWEQGTFRLHHRVLFNRDHDQWTSKLLYP